jgi:hypothetical protein
MGRNHGTLTNFANNGNNAYVCSPDRLALDFDGSDDRIVVPNSGALNPTQGISLSAWFRVTSTTAGVQQAIARKGWIVGTNSQYSIRVLGDKFSGFCVNQSGTIGVATGSTVLATNRWYFGVLTYDRSNVRVFLDGLLEATTALTGDLAVFSEALQIAAAFDTNFNSATLFLGGQLDDIIIFNTALTPNEVSFVYEQGRGGGLLMQPPRRRSVAAILAALVLACETGNYSLTGQAAGLFASRVLAADQAQYILSGTAANITASRLLSADPALYTATGNDAATICARLLDGGAAAYALTGTDAGLIANRKLTADQAVCFLAGNNAELLRALKLNAGSMALQIDNFAASLLADRKISADGAQYILVVSDANLTGSASGVAPYYYLFMMRGPQ